MELKQPDFSLQGQVAMVTGASQGIGYGLAKLLAGAGAKVAVCARNLTTLERLCKEIHDAGGEAKAYELDVTDVSQIDSVVPRVKKDFGSLDILVNNAGLGANHPATDVTEADWDQLMDVNLKPRAASCWSRDMVVLST
jgi:NAD(P)-dependent dehydrogenase (short-subunit alcohol dehydrogenase family)